MAPMFFSSFAVLWAAIPILLSATPGAVFAQAQLTAGCTTNSFTFPSWLIEDFQAASSTNSTAVSFQARNRATNSSAELRCRLSRGNSTSQSCTVQGSQLPVSASLQLEREYARLQINETWTCNDLTPQKPITFSAAGDGALSINCTQDQSLGIETCKPTTRAPLLIKSSLLSPVQITPAYVSGPLGHDNQGCSANSTKPSWEVGASQLNLQVVNGTVQGGTGFVQLKNNVLGYTATCSGIFATGSGFYPLTCAAQSTYRPREKWHIQTVPEFDPKSLVLNLNETWYCDDANPAAPVALTAHGRATLPIICESFSPTTTFCTGDPYTFSGRLVSTVPLPAYTLRDPLPTADSCTISSVVSPAWHFSDLVTTTSGAGTGSVKFGIELATSDTSFTGFPSVVARGNVPISVLMSAEPAWFPCAFESVGELSLTPTNCAFRYDSVTKVLAVSADWKCADLDAAHPVLFTGEVRSDVPELTCTTSGSSTTCSTSPGRSWLANGTSSLYNV